MTRAGAERPVRDVAVVLLAWCRLRSALPAPLRSPGAGGSCVPRSLALVRLLRLHGLAGELRVGMRRTPKGFAGQAWVVHHGAVIAQSSAFVASFAALRLAAGARIRHARAAA